jgi:hypothetical protein
MKKSDIKDLKVGQELYWVRTACGKEDIYIDKIIVTKIESDCFSALDHTHTDIENETVRYGYTEVHGSSTLDDIFFTLEEVVEKGKEIADSFKEYEKAELAEKIEHIDECLDYFLAKVKNKEYS